MAGAAMTAEQDCSATHCAAPERESAGAATRSRCHNCSPVGSAAGERRRGAYGLDGTANSGLREDTLGWPWRACRRDSAPATRVELIGFVCWFSSTPLSLRVTLDPRRPQGRHIQS